MDLDNMKDIWEELSERVEKQKKITTEIILQMTQDKTRNRFRKMFRYEIAGIIWLLLCMAFIILNLDKLNTPVTLAGGVLSIIICITSVVLWISFIRKARRINVIHNSYKQTLIDFNTCYKAFQLNKKLDYFLGIALLISICPVVFKITRKADIFSEVPLSDVLLFVVSGGIAYGALAYLLLSFYDKQIHEINKLLRDLEE